VEHGALPDSEIEILLNDIFDTYGYDFTDYSKASIKRRINRLYSLDRFVSFAEFRYRIRTDETYFRRFIEEVTVTVTEMFRDPTFYKALREQVLPVLGTYPHIRIWHAGCSTGEEVFSMAIMLKEAGLFEKSLIYATDINHVVLEKASQGIFPLNHMQLYSENYIQSGGKQDFSQYYTASYNRAKFDDDLTRKMIFSMHNLVSDTSFNQFQLILCRNVLIYFDKDLQSKVFNLFEESLENLGFLALGSKETIRFSNVVNRFTAVDLKEKIWRKQSNTNP
jgi:chemotaxis protein methyltransferase CheR